MLGFRVHLQARTWLSLPAGPPCSLERHPKHPATPAAGGLGSHWLFLKLALIPAPRSSLCPTPPALS